MDTATLHLELGPRDTTAVLSRPGAADTRWVLRVGLTTLWPLAGGKGDPSPAAIESAIQAVEDELERLHRQLPPGTRLVVAPGALAPLQRGGAIRGLVNEAISLEVIEREYQALAARSLGAPSAFGTGFDDPAGDALVLVLRECLHHLGFYAVYRGA